MPTPHSWIPFLAGLADHLWQSTLVGAAVLGLILACARCPANVRRTLGWLGLAKFALPSVLFLPILKRGGVFADRLFDASALSVHFGFSPGVLLEGRGPADQVLLLRWATPLLIVWLLVSALLFARWLVRGAQASRQMIPEAAPLSPSLQSALQSAAGKLGLLVPRVRALPCNESPSIVGLWRQELALPTDLDRTLGASELESILIHELVHLRRHDNLWGSLQALILSLFWFNPIVWLLSRSVGFETERSCDEEVIEALSSPGTYADAILKLVRSTAGLDSPSFSQATTPPIALRIKSILNHRPRAAHPIMKYTSLSLACLLIVLSGSVRSNAQGTLPSATLSSEANTSEINQLDQKPVPTSQRRPAYPKDLRAAKVSGKAVVDFIIGTDGTVRDAHAISSTQEEFADAAVAAVSKWQFKPGKVGGAPVNTHLQITIVFDLTK